MTTIIWKEIPGQFGFYSASTNGDIRNNRTNKILKQTKSKHGYSTVKLCGGKTFRAHKVIALAILGKPKNIGLQINHKNGIKHDNNPLNLEWVTASENSAHAVKNNLTPNIGVGCHKAKINDDIVRKIRVSKNTLVKDSDEFGISISTISRIKRNENWRHVI